MNDIGLLYNLIPKNQRRNLKRLGAAWAQEARSSLDCRRTAANLPLCSG